MARPSEPPSAETEALGEAVREIREAKKIPQEHAAYEAKIDRSYYGGIENGLHSVGFGTLLKLSRGLGVPAAKIVDRAEKKLR